MITRQGNRPSRLALSKPRENTRRKKKEDIPVVPRTHRGPRAQGILTLAGRVTLVAGVFGLLIGLGVGLFMSYTWLTEHPFFALKNVTVQGNVRLSEEEVLALAEVLPGMNSLAVNIHDVEERVLQNPWIESVAVSREFPDTLSLEVREKAPAFWMQSGDRMHYVDTAGRVIAPVDTGRFTSLPLLAVDQGTMEDVKLLPELLAIMEKKTMPFALGQLAWIRLSSVGVEMFLDGPGLLLRLGSSDLKGEVLRLERVWRDLKERGELTKVSTITVLGTRAWVSRRA